MPSSEGISANQAPENWIVPRAPEVLLELPVPYRWEFTRRHPYYLRFWNLAHKRHTAPSADPAELAIQDAASLILQLIGVSSDPPPPSVSADALDTTALKRAWADGAVAPVTFRGLATMLLAGLPPDAMEIVGRMLTDCARQDDETRTARYKTLQELHRHSHPALNAFPNGPMVGINIQAPANAIVAAIEDLVKQWKADKGIPEQRRRDDKLPEYLKVWDLREGWMGDRYDSRHERTFSQISQDLGVATGTIGNRYRSAFRYIFGHDFTPELWARVIGFLKLLDWVDPNVIPIRPLKRRWRTPSPNPVPESRLQPTEDHADDGPSLNVQGVSQSEIGCVELLLDARSLIVAGLTNDQIVRKLELQSDQASDMIDYLRRRDADAL